jgi:L-lactate utilization protein LutC
MEKEGTQKSLNKYKIAKLNDKKQEILKERMKDEMRTEKNGNIHKAAKYPAYVIRESGMVCAIQRKMCG